MENKLEELAIDFMHKNDCNFIASDIEVPIKIFGHEIQVESIWYSDKEDKIYLHCNCKEFEGDLNIDNLSDENQRILVDVLEKYIWTMVGRG